MYDFNGVTKKKHWQTRWTEEYNEKNNILVRQTESEKPKKTRWYFFFVCLSVFAITTKQTQGKIKVTNKKKTIKNESKTRIKKFMRNVGAENSVNKRDRMIVE